MDAVGRLDALFVGAPGDAEELSRRRVFALGGVYVAIEETLEDSLCAELVPPSQHGMAFGTLATVNGIGDFASSIVVGLLWTTLGTFAAFGYSAALAACGAALVLRVKG